MHLLEGERDPKRQAGRSFLSLFLGVTARMWLYGVLAYAVRNGFQAVPLPLLEGAHGYRHLKTKEVQNSAVFLTSLMLYDNNLKSDVMFLKQALGNSSPPPQWKTVRNVKPIFFLVTPGRN